MDKSLGRYKIYIPHQNILVWDIALVSPNGDSSFVDTPSEAEVTIVAVKSDEFVL